MSLAEQSIAFWDGHQVASFSPDVTAELSLAALNYRNALYPGLLELMPVEGFEGKTVLDFGCGPGHDTIGFLLNGAEHVIAVDASANGLASLKARLCAHDLMERCTLIRFAFGDEIKAQVDHVHTAGVVHHLHDPVWHLAMLRDCLKPGAEIRMMVYAAESELVARFGGPDGFEQIADGGAPIAKAWTQREVKEIAAQADLEATYLGGYLMESESEGPGCGGCWSLKPMGEGWA